MKRTASLSARTGIRLTDAAQVVGDEIDHQRRQHRHRREPGRDEQDRRHDEEQFVRRRLDDHEPAGKHQQPQGNALQRAEPEGRTPWPDRLIGEAGQ